MAIPHLYLDTCVLLDVVYAVRRASPESNMLLQQVKIEVERGNWLCSSSRWAVMELFDGMQEELYVDNLRLAGNLWSNVSRILHNRRQEQAGLKRPDLDSIWKQVHELTTGDGVLAFVDFKYPLTQAMWDKAEDICAQTNIGATDALHLASALESGCNILVTTDGDFTRIANHYEIRAVRPSEVDLEIVKMSRD